MNAALSERASPAVRICCAGTGDAFGSGGRFNACFVVTAGEFTFLLDCGASSLIALRRVGIDPYSIDAALITHLHADHMAGLPFLMAETRVHASRPRPLQVAGPRGLAQTYGTLAEAMFPGGRGDPIQFIQFEGREHLTIGPLDVHTFPVVHRRGTNPHALRVGIAGRTIAYTGDTQWTDTLPEIADGADLLLCECFTPEPGGGHMDLRTLRARIGELRSRRILLSHLGPEMLDLAGRIEFECARDGMVVEI